MPKTKPFQTIHPTVPQRRVARLLCAKFCRDARGKAENLGGIGAALAPVEPTVLLLLLADIAEGVGYEKSKLSLYLDHKAYYLRKRHILWAIYHRILPTLAETEVAHG